MSRGLGTVAPSPTGGLLCSCRYLQKFICCLKPMPAQPGHNKPYCPSPPTSGVRPAANFGHRLYSAPFFLGSSADFQRTPPTRNGASIFPSPSEPPCADAPSETRAPSSGSSLVVESPGSLYPPCPATRHATRAQRNAPLSTATQHSNTFVFSRHHAHLQMLVEELRQRLLHLLDAHKAHRRVRV